MLKFAALCFDLALAFLHMHQLPDRTGPSRQYWVSSRGKEMVCEVMLQYCTRTNQNKPSLNSLETRTNPSM